MLIKLILFILLISFFEPLIYPQINNPPNAPIDLKCDGMINPTNILNFKPEFSWTFSDPDLNDTQSAYRLIVASITSDIDNNIGNVWDTDIVVSSASFTKYIGPNLKISVTYYWKVQTWDNLSSSSPYSTTALFIINLSSGTTSYFLNPYGVNNWNWPLTTCQKFKEAHIDRYRVLVNWYDCELTDNHYNWPNSLRAALTNANILGAKVSLCVYDSPNWVRNDWEKKLAYPADKFAEFITDLLSYCESISSGVVEAVEICNQEPTGEWLQNRPPVYGTDQRDPSWFYANILKSGYNAVKQFNPNLLVVIDGIWYGAYHHLDELYQLGCKGYFDRINFHYYVQGFGDAEDPSYSSSTWHFPTTLQYLKYISEDNQDYDRYIWLTEFGWRITDELKQSEYLRYIIDNCRKSGFVERTNMYVGTSVTDKIAMIIVDNDTNPTAFNLKPAYNMYIDYGEQYPIWGTFVSEPLDTIKPATKNIGIINSGFERGNVTGWEIVGSTDSMYKHSGKFSGKQTTPDKIRTQYYSAEPGRLYEVISWIKVSAWDSESGMINVRIAQRYNNTNETYYEPQNYLGIVDTRNYPDGWRRIRFMYLVPYDKNQIALEFIPAGGTATYWVDDVSIKSLNFISGSSTETLTIPDLAVSHTILDFGEVKLNKTKSMNFTIMNVGDGEIHGNIITDKTWIKVLPSTFSINIASEMLANVTVDNKILGQKQGEYSGIITIESNGGTETITVLVKATCVLIKPNPYNPNKGLLTFFGDGIVPGQTTIKIYTLSGELVKQLRPGTGKEIVWDGKTENGEPVASGIYLYTYESPKEKGIGKFTVIIK